MSETVTGRITGISRLKSSEMGNPRFMLTIMQSTDLAVELRTSPNAGFAYGIENPEYGTAEHVYTIDGRGNVVNVQPVS
jgi:hypothetical protein